VSKCEHELRQQKEACQRAQAELAVMQSENRVLNESSSKLKIDCEAAFSLAEERRTLIERLNVELDETNRMRLVNDDRARIDNELLLERLTQELNEKWSAKLK
jgi:hypothetical protein